MKTHSESAPEEAARRAPARPGDLLLESADLADAEALHALEWLETDGLGGFASGTVSLCPTRRYHGLLVTPTDAFVERHVLLARYEESVHVDGAAFALSVARYGEELLAPEGHRALVRFESAPWPTWEYAVHGARVRRELLQVRGRRVTLCRWTLLDADRPFELELRPLLAFRAADALTVENDVLDETVRATARGCSVAPYAALPTLHLSASREFAAFEASPTWYRGLWYERERARGYDFREDQFSPATLRWRLEPGVGLVVAASIGEPVEEPELLWRRESRARAFRHEALPAGVRGACEAAADAFLQRVPSPSGASRLGVIAGFPWFLEWGRDTFLALPGLTLARGRVDDCADALAGVLEYLDDGLIPNIFGRDVGESHYGSVDAALWFARCVRLFERGGGTRRFVIENFRSALVEIAEAYFEGSRLGLEVDAGGLLHAGDATLNATWMDARTEDGPVTPRAGFAVEIQALWVHLLAHLAELFRDSGLRGERKRFERAHARAAESFVERFWLPRERRLADVWTPEGGPDRRVRPNMVLAAALELSPLTPRQRSGVVACSERLLLTPRGLRTLAPDDPDYRGTYGGGTRERDEAYHQGTVWPWLLGFHVEAALRAGRTGRAARERLRALWDGFAPELANRGIGHLSEVFSGDAPHAAGGTIAQAWNTAECLRSLALLDAPPRVDAEPSGGRGRA